MCPQNIASGPLGTGGSYSVSESGGNVTVAVNESLLGNGIQATLGITLGGAALLNAWAAATSNAELKAILTEAAVLVGALPA